ncbi:hypothetical protein Dda_9327 [Drechslerella dactyloides]|uniref:Uncharacterized protein n=1 Tax=Drechslerella dactyloides TaxID=74499 RepID=A0AAD6IPD6_DREDA|nr:hypothetical protein Dda_9327 [Drechslerella dactyloides]
MAEGVEFAKEHYMVIGKCTTYFSQRFESNQFNTKVVGRNLERDLSAEIKETLAPDNGVLETRLKNTSENPKYSKRVLRGTLLDGLRAIKCASANEILFQMHPDPDRYPKYPHHRTTEARNRTDYREIRGPDAIANPNYRRIFSLYAQRARHWVTLCNDCRCLGNTPIIVPNYQPVRDPLYQLAAVAAAEMDRPRCRNWDYATVCRAWYRCRCNVQRKLLPGSGNETEVDDVEAILSGLKGLLKGQSAVLGGKPTFRDYSEDISSGPASVQVHNALPMAEHKEQVPGSEEPYYIEGSSVSREGTWDWLRSPLLGIGAAWVIHSIGMDALSKSRSSISSIFKRSKYTAPDVADRNSSIQK